MKHVEHVGRPAFAVLALVVLASLGVGARALVPPGTSSADPSAATSPATGPPTPELGPSSSDPVTTTSAPVPPNPQMGASSVATTPGTVPPTPQTGAPVARRSAPSAVATPTSVAEPTALRTLTTVPDGDERIDDDDEARREREPDDRED